MSGREEIPDPNPVEWPLNVRRPLTLQEEIARFMRIDRALQQEHETPEEANDFDVGDDDGDLADGVDRMEMVAEQAFEDAGREFDRGMAEAKENANRSQVEPPLPSKEAPEAPAKLAPEKGAKVRST